MRSFGFLLVGIYSFFCLSLPPLYAGSGRGRKAIDGENPGVKTTTVFVQDWNSDKILYQRRADEVRPIASLSKMWAALVIQEECKLNPDDLHVMSPDNRQAAKGGDRSRLTTGWSFSHRDLMHAALMRSDNRAFPALAEACHMTPEDLGARMTARARSLGLLHTSFAEPTGLSAMNASTAREVNTMLREVMSRPQIAAIMGTKRYTMRAIRKDGYSKELELSNTDRLLNGGQVAVVGGKTGYTDLARYCLAISVLSPVEEASERAKLGIVLMGAEGKLTRFADVRRILTWLRQKAEGVFNTTSD